MEDPDDDTRLRRVHAPVRDGRHGMRCEADEPDQLQLRIARGSTLPAGSCVKRCYLIADNKWVMVSDERRTNRAGRWFFIPRSSLASNPRRLPNILTHGRQGRCPGAL
jgi:hypothetical protein